MSVVIFQVVHKRQLFFFFRLGIGFSRSQQVPVPMRLLSFFLKMEARGSSLSLICQCPFWPFKCVIKREGTRSLHFSISFSLAHSRSLLGTICYFGEDLRVQNSLFKIISEERRVRLALYASLISGFIEAL